MRAVLFAVVVAAGCVRAPARIDVDAMVRQKGALVARQDLEVRAIDDPRDIAVRLALARLADETGRPGQALAELEAVIHVGGPLGTRWHADDKARFARLLALRGRVRLGRGAPSALADLERARSYGAVVETRELERARAAIAIARLRHVDPKERAAGQQALAQLAGTSIAEPSWLGAKERPVPRDRGELGAWLWEKGAKRAAFEALRDWESTTAARGGPLHDAYLRALAWWTPLDLPPPAGTDLSGPERCRFAAAACAPHEALRDPAVAAALLAAPALGSRGRDDADAWVAITLPAALRGELAWGPSVALRVDLDAAGIRGATVKLARTSDADLAQLPPAHRLVGAAGRVLDGSSPARVRAALGPLEGSAEGVALMRIVDPPRPVPFSDPLGASLGAYLRNRHLEGAFAAELLATYRANPARADRLAADLVARSSDAAFTQASLAALFDALGDPARARAAWQAAVDGSPGERAFVAGLAEAAARANDPDAALIHATTAAAASGDPAVAWIAVSRALGGVGKHVHALEAARSAVDLAGPETLGPAIDLALASSRALGRDAQVADLVERRRLAPTPVRLDRGGDDPTDAASALAAAARTPGVVSTARLWIASRWNPRDVELRAALLAAIGPDDPRRATLVTELVALAGDRDPWTARSAVVALRDLER